MGSITFDATDDLRIKYSGFYVDSEDTRALASQIGPVPSGSCNRTYSGSLRNIATGQITGTFSTDLSLHPGSLFCGTIPDWDDVPPNVPFEGLPTAQSSSVPFGAGLGFVRTEPVEFGGKDMVSAPDGLGNNYEVWRNHLGFEYALPNDHTLAGFFSNGESQHWGINDSNYGTPITLFLPFPPFNIFAPTTYEMWFTGFIKHVEDTSVEVRLTSPGTERIRYSVGLSYYQQDIISGGFNLFSGFDPRANIDAQEGDNFGVFGSVDIDLGEAFVVSLEGRWNKDEQEITYEGPSGGDPNAITGEVQDYSAFMPRVIVSWQPPGRALNVYASWSQSYLQGIPTDAATYAIVNPGAGLNPATVGFFTPRQELDAIEVGVKQQIGDWLSYGISVYTMDWDNQTFFDLAPITFTPINLSGDSEYTGLDVEFDARVTDWLQLVGSWTYTDVEFTDFAGTGSVATSVLAPGILVAGTQISSVGNRPRWIPEHNGNISAVIDAGEIFGRAVDFRLDGLYTGDFYVDNFEYNQVDGYWRVNLRAGIMLNDSVRAEIFGLNVFDDRSWSTSNGTTSITGSADRKTFAYPTRGAEWGLRITAAF